MADSRDSPSLNASCDAQAIVRWMRERLARELNIAVETIPGGTSFADLGLGSRQLTALAGELEEWLGRSIPASSLFAYPSIDALSRGLAGSQPFQDFQPGVPPAGKPEPVAIVGIACRFPGAPDLSSFWQLLVSAREAIREVPPERWRADEFYDPTPGAAGKMVTRRGGFLERIDEFDASYFGISPREAACMDPQQRLLLEGIWDALTDAGLPPKALAGSKSGVFVGL